MNFMAVQSAMLRRNLMVAKSTRVFGSKDAASAEGYMPPSISQAGDILKVNYTEEFDQGLTEE
jgi:hypothetical protein